MGARLFSLSYATGTGLKIARLLSIKKTISLPLTHEESIPIVKQEPNKNSTSGLNGQLTGKKTPPRGYETEDMQRRVDWLAQQTGHRIKEFSLEEPTNYKGLVENQIGYIGMPLSIAGPLKIAGNYANGDFYVPLCTLE